MSETAVMNTSTTQSQQNSSLAWFICLVSGLFFFYEFIHLTMFNAISTDLMATFHINSSKLGEVSSSFLWANALFLFPAGIILDRISTRKIILTAMSTCIIATFFLALSTNIFMVGAFHFIAGIGNAFCFLASMKLASRWFTPNRLALITGALVTMAMAGGMLAQTPLTLLGAHFGWREALMMYVGLGLVLVSLIAIFVKDAPQEKLADLAKEKEHLAELHFWKTIGQVIKRPQNWFCGMYTSFLNLPIMVLGALWGNAYLHQVDHISLTQASLINSMLFLGTIIGGPVIGAISDNSLRRRRPMILFAILSLAAIFAIEYIPHLTVPLLFALYLLLGFFTSAQIIGYPAIAESNPISLTGTAIGLASVLIMGGGALFQVIFSDVLALNWDGKMAHGAPVYSSANFHEAMIIFPIMFVVALIASLLTKETHCKQHIHGDDN